MPLKNLDEGTFVSIQEWEKVGCNEKGIGRSLLLGCIVALGMLCRKLLINQYYHESIIGTME